MTSDVSSTSYNNDPMHKLLKTYSSALKAFTTSSSTFQILHTLGSPISHFKTPSSPLNTSASPQKSLYILDSSFNPPTLAHLRIATNALLHDVPPQSTITTNSEPMRASSKRLLLLLAIQNADKAAKPASFEQRLVMMTIFAQDLLSSLSASTSTKPQLSTSIPPEQIGIDIALTKCPYFHSKAEAISESSIYGVKEKEEPEQVHLTGYDTLLRILSPKYYPPTHTLSPLHPFLSQHRLLVAYRADDKWGTRGSQDAYLAKLGDGELEEVEGKREWVHEGRIRLVEGRKEYEAVVSSTKVRSAVKRGDRGALRELVTEGVAEWVLGEGLYLED